MFSSKGWMVAAVLMGAATSAMADGIPRGEVLVAQQKVRFGDLDLASRSGVATLHRRLRKAASAVCGPAAGFTYQPQQRKCRSAALERALATVPATVSIYHAQWMAGGADWLASPEDLPGRELAVSR